ncbi:Zinc/iron permease [Lophiostoma macrostomum CBS 122681]|uniref:Zinc/iron permease n=1 Tax=Lophiostoma macrostomum CBS 122681 TaxID=1314788 RepID=A0A6A6TEE5_9PLEO|nr:Zinc/iron permease [Lophiostoma macrostomum CBS 122681]
MVLDNDTRGWIMAAVSGIASVICVDLIVRLLPGKKNFKIEESNSFLSSGLSLSFGVMIFSSLYSMLPSARNYLQKGGMAPKAATFTLIGCFLVGAFGISILSRILHQYIPHSVVNCDHDHGDEEEGKADELQDCDHDEQHEHGPMEEQHRHLPSISRSDEELQHYRSYSSAATEHPGIARRPSLHTQISTKMSQLVSGSKEYCDDYGQCFGYNDPCGAKCFRNVQHPRGVRKSPSIGKLLIRPSGLRSQTTPHERQPLLQSLDEDTAALTPTVSGPAITDDHREPRPHLNGNGHSHSHSHSHHHPQSQSSLHKHSSSTSLSPSSSSSSSHQSHSHHQPQHHHHVPTNTFLSIGLQTSTAIALHKIPEGFITYATNHANPRLGFAIFLALFIHNITEGFAMALPLYLAINSRTKAILWSALLGGVSQPLGAAVAALWFRLARRGSNGEDGVGEPGDTVYGAMFAVTAGIMAMVSLQLFGEALDLTHSRRLCFAGAFLGMGILGCSSALTA